MTDSTSESGEEIRRYRLTKQDKLTLRADFAEVKANGRKAAGPLLAAAIAPGKDGLLRAGVICGKKYCLLAVKRNRARRLVWESFRLLKPWIAPCHLVFIPRRRMQNAKCADVKAELERHLRALGVWRAEASGDGRSGC